MRVEEKREQKIQIILETALTVWSKEEFQNTSLSPLASRLGLTKQALYRYFKNKEDLLKSLNLYIRKISMDRNDALLEELRKLPGDKRMEKFVRIRADLNRRDQRGQIFDSFWLMRYGQMPQRISVPQMNQLLALLEINPREYYLISFLNLMMWGWGSEHHMEKSRSFEEKVGILMELITHGLGTSSFRIPSTVLHVKDMPELKKSGDLLKSDKLFYSITMAIQEQGFNGVTLENIAKKAKLSKSSLYNYFKNKDEMLTKTINRFVTEYSSFHSVLLSRFDSFEEKLIAHLELQQAVLPVKPLSIMQLKQLLDRDVLRKIRHPGCNPDFLGFIQDGIDKRKLKPLLSPREYQIIFSSFVFIEKFIFCNEHRDEEIPWMLGGLKMIITGIRKDKGIGKDL